MPYLTELAKSRPSFIRGRITGSSGHHPLEATGSFVVGVIGAVAAWFILAYTPKPQAAAPTDRKRPLAAKRHACFDVLPRRVVDRHLLSAATASVKVWPGPTWARATPPPASEPDVATAAGIPVSMPDGRPPGQP
jgi:hypothetical protein